MSISYVERRCLQDLASFQISYIINPLPIRVDSNGLLMVRLKIS